MAAGHKRLVGQLFGDNGDNCHLASVCWTLGRRNSTRADVAIVVEGFTVVVRLDRIQGKLTHPTFELPNATALFDDHLWRCAFMAEGDARSFLNYLGKLGMKVEPGPDCEAVLVDEFELAEERPCEWLNLAKWEKAVIAWRAGTEPEKVVASEGWDPKKGSGLTRENLSEMGHLEFLGEENGVETYLNKKTGKKVYSSRTKSPSDTIFERASKIILANFVDPGGKSVSGESYDAVSKAASELEQVLSLEPARWNVLWFHGKAMLALGKTDEAYRSFSKAREAEPNVEAIYRELAGVCLELRKFDEGVAAAERAVALNPQDAGLVGNLALAQFLAGRLSDAKRSSARALEIDAGDKINLHVRKLIDEVASGRRPQPESLADLRKPAKPKKPSWKFW